MRLFIRISSLLLFGFVVGALAQTDKTDTLEVITLQHRPAETLIPLIQPLVDDVGIVTGRNDQLIVRTTQDQFAQIRTLVRELDTPPVRLLVTVQQLQGAAVQQQGLDLTGNALTSDPLVMSNGHNRQKLHLESEKHHVRHGDNLFQQIQVIAGSEAFIEMGKQLPFVEPINRVDWIYSTGPYGSEYNIQSEPVKSGFYVRPQVHGDWVTLEVLPHREQPSSNGGGRILKQQIATTITGQLGEWLEVSSQHIHNHRKDHTIVHSTQAMDQTNRRVLVKVNRIP